MESKLIKPVARILIIIIMLTQLSALFPMFSLFHMVSEAAILTTAQIESLDNQKWLIDEIIRQVRLTRPTVSSISQVTTEELESITIINLDGITATGNASRCKWAYSIWYKTSYKFNKFNSNKYKYCGSYR